MQPTQQFQVGASLNIALNSVTSVSLHVLFCSTWQEGPFQLVCPASKVSASRLPQSPDAPCWCSFFQVGEWLSRLAASSKTGCLEPNHRDSAGSLGIETCQAPQGMLMCSPGWDPLLHLYSPTFPLEPLMPLHQNRLFMWVLLTALWAPAMEVSQSPGELFQN